MPPQATLHTYSGRIFATLCASGAQKDLDSTRTLSMDIIIFTSQGRHSGDLVNARQAGKKVQARRPQAARHAESASERGDRPPIRNWRFLRSRRCRTGQVRDASPRHCRQTISHAVRSGIRLLTPYLLSSGSGLSARWTLRAIAREARATARPRTHAGGSGLRYTTPGKRSFAAPSGLGCCHPGTVRCECSSTEYRTRTEAAGKKNVAASSCWRMQDSIGNTDLRLRRSTATSRRGFEFSWPGHGHFSWPGNGGMDAGVLLGWLYQSRQRPPVSDHCRTFAE